MSDVESVISEEIDYRSDNGSDSYHPSEENYDDDSSDAKNAVQKVTIRPKFQANDPVKTNAATKVTYKTSLTSLHSISDDDGNDYSVEFEETSAQSHFSMMYSNDFEDEGDKTVSKTPVRMSSYNSYNSMTNSGRNRSSSTPLQHEELRLPGLNTASFQAEIALEEISKEVVRLRNQQRNLLQERRQIAREKKLRAESRRAQYDLELRDLKQKLKLSEETNESLTSQIGSIQKNLEITVFNRDTVQTDLDIKEKESDEIKEKVVELQAKLKKYVEDLHKEKSESRAKEDKWIEERSAFKAEILRNNLLSAVVQQSLEANEIRLGRERERLPEEHRRLLEEQMARNTAMEGSLIDRERSLRAEETRRFSVLEVRARESADDISRARTRADLDILEEKNKIQTQRELLVQEKNKIDANVAREKNELSVQLIDLARREAGLKIQMNDFKRLQADFESSKLSVEPMLRATAEDREKAIDSLKNAERMVIEAAERAEGVLLAETGLRKMEEDLIRREGSVEELRSKYYQARKVMQMEAKNILNAQKDLKAEKFRLHSAAIELASQTSEFRHSVGLISKYGRSGNAVTLHPNQEPFFTGQSKEDKVGGVKISILKSNRKGGAGVGTLDPQYHSRNQNSNKMRTKSKSDGAHNPSSESSRSQHYSKNSSSSAQHDVNGTLDPDLLSPPSVSGPSDEEKSQERSQESSLGDSNEDIIYAQPPDDVIDSLGVLDRISASMQGLTEKFSEKESPIERIDSAQSNPNNESIVFSNRNAAPYDFMGESGDFDEFGFEEIGNFEGPGSGLRVRSSSSFIRDREVIDTQSQHSYSYDVEIRKEPSMHRQMEQSSTDDWRRRELPSLTSLRSEYYDRRDLDHFQNSLNLNLPSRYGALGADVEDSNLKLAVDKASEQANGLFAAAAKYGIYH